tara:strand:- start:3016 stop:3702 length:687 start_codon:yes stop_codon:yes gene_type:complete
MYVAPALRNEVHLQITNLCDEFFHIDDTPEAKIQSFCVGCNCIRKSVTCVATLSQNNNQVYSCVYKNKVIEDGSAIHAEMFLIGDTTLRSKLNQDQVLTLYLTFQPCHFSGGHRKISSTSCTEALRQFYYKTLEPLNIELIVKFGYIYRAHWIKTPLRYMPMIENARSGLKILKTFANVQIIDERDYKTLYNFCDDTNKKAWNNGEFDDLFNKRIELVLFMKDFLLNL